VGLVSCASGASLWRGYEYYVENRISDLEKIDDTRFRCKIRGSGIMQYDVCIDTMHARSSTCTCPHAAGRKIICKHMIALYFTVFPDEAAQYKKEIDDCERREAEYRIEEEERRRDLKDELKGYIKGMSKAELRNKIIEILLENEWLIEEFMSEDSGDFY